MDVIVPIMTMMLGAFLFGGSAAAGAIVVGRFIRRRANSPFLASKNYWVGNQPAESIYVNQRCFPTIYRR